MSTYVAVFALLLAYVALVVAWLAVRSNASLRRMIAAGGAAGPARQQPRQVEVRHVERPVHVPEELIQATQRNAQLSGSLATQIEQLRAHLDATRAQIDATAAEAFARIEQSKPDASTTLSNIALVRYDAFGGMSGRASFSLALLDSKGDGVTITALAGTNATSVYAKGVRGGQGEHDLSPEEQQAVSTALHRPKSNLLGRRAS